MRFHTPVFLLALLVPSGCNWVDKDALDALEANVLDPDGDGTPSTEDCAPEDPSLAAWTTVYADTDGDGFGDVAVPTEICLGTERAGYVTSPEDCDDGRSDVNPAAPELCNLTDDNCDGLVDDDDPGLADPEVSFWLPDADGDGFPSDDNTALIAACVAPSGFTAAANEADCDDRSTDDNGDGTADGFPINPGQQELCGDDVDNDCNGEVDEFGFNDAAWYPDSDQDGWPDNLVAVERCDGGDGLFVPAADFDANGPVDCDPADPNRSPGLPEIWYDGVDSDCDNADDYDQDGDGFVPPVFASLSPLPSGDCEDQMASVSPVATETCNGIDDDCDALVDEEVADPDTALTALIDMDQDGFPSALTTLVCGFGDGLIDPALGLATDCDDTAFDVNPGAEENWYDGVDGDCSGGSDYDQDGDGYVPDLFFDASDPGSLPGGDCQDAEPSIHAGAVESCNGEDDDCDGEVDEGEVIDPSAVTALVDADLDGHPAANAVAVCAFGPGFLDPTAGADTDCDDDDPGRFPSASELPGDGVDQDCTGFDLLFCYADNDGDGWGGATVLVDGADCGPAATDQASDCDDLDAQVHPGAPELCDNIDQDCNALDPLGVATAFYSDGSVENLTGDFIDLFGVERVALCGGEFSLSFLPNQQLDPVGSGVQSTVIESVNFTSQLTNDLGPIVEDTSGSTFDLTFRDVEFLTVDNNQPLFRIEGNNDLPPVLSLEDVTLDAQSLDSIVDMRWGRLVVDGFYADELVYADSLFVFDGVEAEFRDSDFANLNAGVASSTDSQVRIDSSTFSGGTQTAFTVDFGSLSLTNSAVSDFSGPHVGAIDVTEATLTLDDSTANGNHGITGGAIRAIGSTVIINDALVNSNLADEGAAVWLQNSLLLFNGGEAAFNTASAQGAAVYAVDSSVTVRDSILWRNTASLEGGAIYAEASTLDIEADFDRNEASSGGAIHTDGDVSITGAVTDNEAMAGSGGAIWAAGTVETGGTFRNNMAFGSGGAIRADHLSAESAEFTRNTATSNGGAVRVESGVVHDTQFIDNGAQNGGAVYVPIQLSVSSVWSGEGNTYRDNSADFYGGAISDVAGGILPSPANNTLFEVDAFFEGNNAEFGGALAVAQRQLGLLESELNGNQARHGGGLWGGAPLWYVSAPIIYSETSFRNNQAELGGAVYVNHENVNWQAPTLFENNIADSGALFYVVDFDVHVDDLQNFGNTAADGSDVFLSGPTHGFTAGLNAGRLEVHETVTGERCTYNSIASVMCDGTGCTCP